MLSCSSRIEEQELAFKEQLLKRELSREAEIRNDSARRWQPIQNEMWVRAADLLAFLMAPPRADLLPLQSPLKDKNEHPMTSSGH